MTRLTRKLMISILTVVLSISALGTTTFAWFTLTNTATVENFSANIVSDTGIEISLDGKNWYNALSETLIQNYITAKYGTFAFNHVTSQNGSTFSTLGTAGLDDVTNGSNHLSIKLYFRTETVTKLAWTNVVVQGATANWLPDVSFTASDNLAATPAATIPVNPANAMRVSVVSPEEITPITPTVFERPVGAYLGSYNTVLGSGGDISNGGIGDPGAMNYYYRKSGDTLLPFGLGSWGGDPLVWTATPVVVAPTVTTLPVGASSVIMNFQSTDANGEIYYSADDTTVDYNTALGGYIIVNIWFEGYDAEAYNSLLSLPVVLGLEFKGYPIV